MGKFKKIEDFADFNPIRKGDTVSFGINDFENLIIAVEFGVTLEISEGRKTISGHAVEAICKYIEGEIEVDEVVAELNNLKHQSTKQA